MTTSNFFMLSFRRWMTLCWNLLSSSFFCRVQFSNNRDLQNARKRLPGQHPADDGGPRMLSSFWLIRKWIRREREKMVKFSSVSATLKRSWGDQHHHRRSRTETVWKTNLYAFWFLLSLVFNNLAKKII